ncbi:MAG: NAD(P)/FAD-dependent oxidoreductase [Roseivivax sp.]|nr:NAD(P)/FAD-dependent oxidoreductase [Roseivivax sp.]
MQWDVIVIGGGLGGLTAGAMCARAGFRVLLLERNQTVGGAATSFTLNSRAFEASLREMLDPATTLDPNNCVFNALDLFSKVDLVPIPQLYRVCAPHLDLDVTLPHGSEELLGALSALFPEDREAIGAFLRHIQRSREAVGILAERHNGAWWQGSALTLPLDFFALYRDFGATLSSVMDRFFGDNERLKIALAANLGHFTDDPDRFWWMTYAMLQGGYMENGGCYVRGGSAQLSHAMADIIVANGGHVRTNATVERILVSSNGQAFGVALAGGEAFHGTMLFGNAAPHALADMLPEGPAEAVRATTARHALSISLFEMHLGLNRPAADLGVRSYSTILIPDWMNSLSDFTQASAILGDMPGTRMPPVIVTDYGQIDSGLEHEGIAPMGVSGIDRLENWEGLDEATYHARKAAWQGALLDLLERQWPGMTEAIDIAETSTARTVASKLGTPGGAVYGYAPTPPRQALSGRVQIRASTAVPGLWLASAFSGFGGYAGALASGANAALSAVRATMVDRQRRA